MDANEINRIYLSLEKLHGKIDKNTNTLIINTQDLKHHIKRTNLLEQKIFHTDKKVGEIDNFQQSVLTVFKFLGKFLALLGIIIGIGAGIFTML